MTDLEGKIARLEAYEGRCDVTPLDFEQIIGPDLWERHWRNRQRVLQDMKEGQDLAVEIKAAVRAYAPEDLSNPAPRRLLLEVASTHRMPAKPSA